jgi:hypothetical protein
LSLAIDRAVQGLERTRGLWRFLWRWWLRLLTRRIP